MDELALFSLYFNYFKSLNEFVFEEGKLDKRSETDKQKDQLLKTIGELKVENDFLKEALR